MSKYIILEVIPTPDSNKGCGCLVIILGIICYLAYTYYDKKDDIKDFQPLKIEKHQSTKSTATSSKSAPYACKKCKSGDRLGATQCTDVNCINYGCKSSDYYKYKKNEIK